jgi:RNA 3'-terminal phosphate cyclase (ATP)
MMVIDGSIGEGGGQILRTALGLSIVTGRPFRLVKVRAGRAKPGLLRQHLASVRAAAAIGAARVTGDHLGSTELTFEPTGVVTGEHRVEIGSAGSALLVVQAALPAMLSADRPTTLVVVGGTHNPSAPPAPFVERVFLPCLRLLGADVRFTCVRPGFYPNGGGEVRIDVTPARLTPASWLERGDTTYTATALMSALSRSIGAREVAWLGDRLDIPADRRTVEQVAGPVGPGNAVWVEAAWDGGRALFTGFGERGRSAEDVAKGVFNEVLLWEAARVPVDAHLADQLLVPLALAGGGAFRTTPPTPHCTTNAEIIRRFLPVEIAVETVRAGVVEVRVARCSLPRSIYNVSDTGV